LTLFPYTTLFRSGPVTIRSVDQRSCIEVTVMVFDELSDGPAGDGSLLATY
jgi:hypothetical protein